ncbi:MAG: NADH-quinone oxidoreductase subunit NuoH [Chloroflexota bacterium]|jgi:NADH-quinone oxidoreductase subunit H|nr:NADH-quinone oxidoreductase subunit NuoH [Anaerolineaceae bacterium]MDP6769335.1 NADH-quinone oxidoreductase subunit NuoH [Anaerolineales bacterium]MEE3227565.1 NADH-quinone oxidoreductase subunit NuoH [Chloroflexota bacterium]HJO90452.1 NADH-quinone oxidoreductase subunit NuoH [Anaerolineales bacterium]|tara:strand:+ start:1224 stop:2225 length:1002 start_codon:yes stop_codon:yes gene_type:complete
MIGIAIEALIKSALIAFVLLTAFAYLTFAERKIAALMQVRKGPNRVGPWGLLQPAADGIKLIFKEEVMPAGADKVLFFLAPILTMIPAIVIVAVIPLGPDVELFGRTIRLGISDLNVGLLYILAIASVAVYGIVLAGWSSANKYALLGGLRASAQMISYEIALGLSIIGPIMLAGTLSLQGIVQAQQSSTWYVLWQPLGAMIFLIAGLAELNRAPFDMPEAEQELTAGYFTEYSGMKFSLFFMGEYIKMVAVSAIATTLFFGGYLGPFVDKLPWLGILYFAIKTAGFLFLMIWIRLTLPRLRYDQLMAFGWKVLLPLALFNVVITAVVIVFVG